MESHKDTAILVLTAVLVLVFAQTIFAMPIEEEEYSPEYKSCLLECLTCVEMWGDVYNGQACADKCLITDGTSIDHECRLGVKIGKRYLGLKATNDCIDQCKLCSTTSSSSVHYNDRACVAACELSSGLNFDKKCEHHLNMYTLG
ncbi:uncharacterized protein LOC128209982 [Mya arenaria]|uniref:uncharacterized protein LOC128209982 n=1 Tax=Mya arenaria TaxID=6604 RepID=UPI0022E39C5B|nr:uncharacterized protein LOC128209982 [Mya arenaria]